jgi:glycosyltransferase involved in cell wall biosynthesis
MRYFVLFFTRNVSLKQWYESGLLSREKGIYELMLERNYYDKIYWLTYGVEDKLLAIQLKKEGVLDKRIEILDLPKFLNNKTGRLFFLFFPYFFYHKLLKKALFYKTNQMDGAISAVISKVLYRKKLLLRTGFVLSYNIHQKYDNSILYVASSILEYINYNIADNIIVTSDFAKKYIIKKYRLNHLKIKVLGNYILTNKFYDEKRIRQKRLLFVGRLEEEKNIFNLLDAVKQTSLGIDIFGEGTLKQKITNYIINNKIDAFLFGKIDNSELTSIYNSYEYYILPSLYEGMSKTLLEAMSCGCICLVSNVPGNVEIIEHKYNGLVIDGTNSNSIVKAINMCLNRQVSLKGIKLRARETILNRFSLNFILNGEHEIVSK